jgi:hypothetical protein
VAVDLDVGISVGDRGQRGRDRGQRLGHAAHQHHGQQHHQQRGDTGRDGHVRDGVRQHGLELRHRDADIEDANDFARRVHDRIVGGHEGLAEQRCRPLVGLAAAQDGLSGMVRGELGADSAVAVLLLDVGGTSDKLVTRLVVDEQGRVAAGIAHRAIYDRVILELGHLRHFGAGDHPVLDGDLGVAVGLGKSQAQRAQVHFDVTHRPVAELVGQRPMGGAYNQRGIDRDQKNGGDDGLGAKPKLQRRQELSNRTRGHNE